MMCCNSFSGRVAALVLLASLLAACGGGGGADPTATPSPTPTGLNNVLSLVVDGGPPNSGYNVNRLYASVTVCQPGSRTLCQTIDHVLVDTGSTGLRLLSSLVPSTLNLTRLAGSTGFPLLNCAQFVDNTFAWGPVVSADILLGEKSAAAVPIQLIADAAFGSPASGCSVGGTAMTTAKALGANGILGVGLFKDDCGSDCSVTAHNGSYYTCTDASCRRTVGAVAILARQLKNPVPLFAQDNNGVVIDLPAVAAGGAASVTGSLIFGVGTQSNNQFTPGAVLTTDALGNLTTLLLGRSYATSFLDTGSNGLYFDSTAIASCTASNIGFYCPLSRRSLSATLTGANAKSSTIAFDIDNATALFSDGSKSVLPTLSGPLGDGSSFDWGLPFFYGRRVFIGIEGQSSPVGSGPYYVF